MDSKETKDLLIRLEEHAVNTAKRTERLEVALVGDPSMGNKGIIKRIEEVEDGLKQAQTKQRKFDKKMVVFGALGTGAILGIKGICQKFFGMFN